jgi:hypothetical protein
LYQGVLGLGLGLGLVELSIGLGKPITPVHSHMLFTLTQFEGHGPGLGLGPGLVELSIGLGLGERPFATSITSIHSHMLSDLTQFEGHGEVDIYIIKYFSDVHMFFL